MSKVADVQKTLTNKNACITAKRINKKDKKSRRKNSTKSVDLANIDDADTTVYDHNTDMRDISSTKRMQIAADKYQKVLKNVRLRTQSFPLNLSDIADAENY